MKKAKFASALLAAVASLALVVVGMPMAFATAASYDTAGATRFVFSDSGIDATDGDYTGYKVKGTALTINEAGTYTVSGSCADGSITVKKGTTGVTLVLDGLTLTSADTAPIACNKSTEVTIVAADGSVNALADAAANNDDNYPDNENAENAVIKCKDGSKVTLGGTGTLTVTANGKNGIKSGVTTDTEGEAWMTIEDLTLTISAPVNDGINAEATLSVRSGQLTIDAADDAIHSDYTLNIGETGTTGPTIAINSCYEGLEAATLNVFSGDITIQATDDCLNAANSDLTDFEFTMNISGGSIHAYTTAGDGFDSNGDLTISGGTVVVWSANTADNQPLDADGTITISGGTVLAAGGSGGMGMNLNATQPYVIIGNTGMGGQPGQPGQSGEQPTPPSGQQPEQSGEQPTPPSGQQPSQSGEQPSQPGQGTQTNASVTAGSTIHIQDADGNTLYTGTAPCNASYFVFSSPELTSGSSYTLYAADTSVGSATAQTGTTSGNTPGGQPGGQPGSGEQPPVKPDDGEQPPAKPDDTGSTGTTSSTSSSSTSTSGSTTGSTTGSTGSSDSSSTTASSSDSSTSSTGTTTTSEDADTAATDSTTSSKKSRKNKSTTTNTDEDSDSSSDTKKSPSKHGKKETSDESSNTPKTGESSHTILWIVLLVLSGGTLVVSLILWKKKSEE